jgi:nucleotide-binding universal stress UspA family protein
MYRTILVPLDGSTFSERALPIAASLQRVLGSRLVLVRAASASVIPGMDPTMAQCQAIDEAEAYLQGVADLLAEQRVEVNTAVPYGDAADAIRLEIRLQYADLVVMCTHGRSGLGRWIYGSVAESILVDGTAPILLVRPTGIPVRLTGGPGQPRLIVPLDGSAFAETTLPHAIALAGALGAALELLHVVTPQTPVYPRLVFLTPGMIEDADRLLRDDSARAAAYLAEIAGRLAAQAAGVDIQATVEVGAPADVILREAQIRGARLVVMATHGRTGLQRMLLGSVAHEVVHRSLLPVLLVHPPAPPKAPAA